MKKFRLSAKDTVKGTVSGNDKILATIYDSGFNSFDSVCHALIRNIPYFSGKILSFTIYVENKGIKYITKKVNKYY